MYMYVRNDLKKIKLHFNLFKWFSEGARIPLDPPQVRMHRGNCNLTMADSKLFIKVCDILFMRSHEARPSNIPPQLDLGGGQSNPAVPSSQNFGGDSPSLSSP